MQVGGREVVRFRGRYYIKNNPLDAFFEELGDQIIDNIPSAPEEYEKWLESKRAEYAAKELVHEQFDYEVSDGDEPQFYQANTPPTALPRLDKLCPRDLIYITNLDREVLTFGYGVHWNMKNIPRQGRLWLRAIAEETSYSFRPTISFDMCPEEHAASPALEFPERDSRIGYASQVATPRTDLEGAREVFLMRVLAGVLIEYKTEILRFAREWAPDSFPFRELAFALVSIASGHARFEASDPPPDTDPEEYQGDWPPLEFGSMKHRPGKPPGASPAETMYWHENVLVSLTLVVDGAAISKAVAWGIAQGRTPFQVVVMSLFEVAFADASHVDGAPLVTATKALYLSPLRPEYCLSTHPRERPVPSREEVKWMMDGESLMEGDCAETVPELRELFSGLAALVNFFRAAAGRRAVPGAGCLPFELYGLILDHIDCDTWKACSVVSQDFRALCLRNYRVDESTRIVAGPHVAPEGSGNDKMVFFDLEDMLTGEIFSQMQVMHREHENETWGWMPVVGCRGREVLMRDVVVCFETVEDGKRRLGLM